ncbi:unnamed protein product [Prunus armeniaca]
MEANILNSKDETGRTPLHYAASIGYLEGVRFLGRRLVDSHRKDHCGNFPIHHASSKGHVNIVKELLQHCPDSMELRNSSDQNILHDAARCGEDNLVKYFFKNVEFQMLINQKQMKYSFALGKDEPSSQESTSETSASYDEGVTLSLSFLSFPPPLSSKPSRVLLPLNSTSTSSSNSNFISNPQSPTIDVSYALLGFFLRYLLTSPPHFLVLPLVQALSSLDAYDCIVQQVMHLISTGTTSGWI